MLYSSLDVNALTGVSLRQLQWWDEQGVVTPMQRGHRRLYNTLEVLQVSLIMGLRRKGMSLQKIRKVLHKLHQRNGANYFQLHARGADVYLLTDGEDVFLENSERGIVDILKDSNQPIISLCVSDLIRRLDAPAVMRKPVQSETSSVGRQRVSRAS
jgi:DNA-binding transcriptional MerR regulator